MSQASNGTRRTPDQPLSIRPVRCVALPDPARLQQNGATVETAHGLGKPWVNSIGAMYTRPIDPPDMKNKQLGGQRGVETSVGHFATSKKLSGLMHLMDS